ncbi:hypothetical protein HQ36_01420 [Porphyromonas gingivicanis]|uniref:Uncharacterized protein n=2 Tax=Porphyromonas gingivicanis TaxID=266762 RepID=A0A0A2G7B0_9PORP|nr:hypothetical protein [Porphyromonas gingivicanis]KGN99146.1 hypothetical protein HQ36_01420 [Porphyromonas gingivicanis]
MCREKEALIRGEEGTILYAPLCLLYLFSKEGCTLSEYSLLIEDILPRWDNPSTALIILTV